MKVNINEKRVLKGYKIKDSIYKKAMKRSVKEKGALATMIECVVLCYAEGCDIKAVKYKAGEGLAMDIFSNSTPTLHPVNSINKPEYLK